MTCDECAPLIPPALDGELPAARAAAVAEHLAGCADCTRAHDELARLVAAARALPPIEPPPHLWTRIDAHLDEEDGRRAPSRFAGWRRWLLFPSLATLACGAIVGGWALHHSSGPSDAVLLSDAQAEFQQAESHYRHAIADLRMLAGRERTGWQTPRAARYDRELAALDATVEKAQVAARARAADPDAEEHLYGAYRAQIAFLEESLLRSAQRDPVSP